MKEIVHRGFNNFYLVKLVDIDFEVELPGERLTIVKNDAGNEDAVVNRQKYLPADLPPR